MVCSENWKRLEIRNSVRSFWTYNDSYVCNIWIWWYPNNYRVSLPLQIGRILMFSRKPKKYVPPQNKISIRHILLITGSKDIVFK